MFFLAFLLLEYPSSYKVQHKEEAIQFKREDKFFEIKCEELIENKKIIGLSNIAANVEYIPLETNDACLIANGKYFFTDSLIFVSNNNHILEFSRRGKFLRKIGSQGRGPGEIDLIRIMSILPEKKLIVVQKNSQNKLLYYSFNGDLIKSISIPNVYNMKVVQDGKYIAYEVGSTGSEKYTFRLTNESNDTISVVNNYTNWPYVHHLMFIFNSFVPFYYFRNNYFFKALYNDTVYTISSNRIIPNYFIKLGKYKLPDELRPERIDVKNIKLFSDNCNNYFFSSVFEAENRIFLGLYSYGRTAPKFMLYDKVNNKGNLLINDKGSSTGFINDWDGGLDFWPTGNIDDNQIFMPIDILKFQKELKSNSIKENVKFPEKQKQLQKIILSQSITNNPIIMIVKLKNKIYLRD